jgi:hypothetical protein
MMIKAIIGIIVLCWIGYNIRQVFKAPRNAVEVDSTVKAKCPQDFAFQAYMNVREYYLNLSPAHKRYEMSGTNLLEDVVINVWETAGFQFVKHAYRVTELVPNERMRLVSERSQVRVLGLFKGVTRSEVEFRFLPAEDDRTSLGLTIRIVFPNWFRHLLARLFFTETIWRSHARGEMQALARIIEQRYAIETA